ncbi:hypothetical protein WMF04_14555 [Sorangium sp. So ce260]|uniref:hypothetical protein n=1 Tax=Sorangium sp. So ce260 TaxID=3133291 RepID=UPI003F646E12
MKKQSSRPYEKDSRCWPGYEPVPGKRPDEQGSCRKKPASRNGGVEVDRDEAQRKAEQAARSPEEKSAVKTKSSSPKVRAEGRRTAGRAGSERSRSVTGKRAPRKSAAKKGTGKRGASSRPPARSE